MNTGGDAAERLVRDSLMITEEAVKLAGLGAKNLAAILVALAKEEEKTHGPTRLTRLLRSGEELKLLPIKSEDLRQFLRLAKEYGPAAPRRHAGMAQTAMRGRLLLNVRPCARPSTACKSRRARRRTTPSVQ